ncbi:potassium-transporting ATPase subunit KdpC [Planctomicrobium sp. SH661]|uniref:potassium-transporting ATPase subunit KdpC n=1 Tax=Planctomicrobium sp. SH661 TaxID=3448124 RepID=UPI003F5C0F30
MLQQLRSATLLLIALTALTGGVYPLVATVVAQTVFPHQANGSLQKHGQKIVGSELIGQQFTRPEYFWGRLSATSPVPYNAAASSGSNYGPLHPSLKQAAESRISELQKWTTATSKIPVDLVTASGSGLDPHISVAAAEFQVPRIAPLRNMTEEQLREMIHQHTAGRQFGILGEPRVHVLQLNLALDQPPTK